MRRIHASLAVLSLLLVVPAARAQDAGPPAGESGTRLLFGPTARSLPKGQVYFGVYEFLMPFVQVGVTDRISFGGGTPLFIGVDESHRPFWITPKVQIVRREGTDVAVGALHAFVPGEGAGGVGYVVATHGSDAGSFTAGAGVGYLSDGGRAGVIMIGGEHLVRPGLKFVTESYVWKGGSGMACAGVRFFGDRLSADVALGVPFGFGETYAFPVVNFVYNF
jgi:hypothetical protein